MLMLALSHKTVRRIAAGACAALALAVFLLYGSERTAPVFAPKDNIPIYSVKTSGRQIALTFDAASGSDTMDALIGIFDKYHIKVTFFVTGRWAELYPEDLRKLCAHGHEVGSHGYRHIDYVASGQADVRKDLNLASDAIEKISGQRPTLFRAPYGAWNAKTVDIVCGQQYEFIQWDVDSLDWMGLKPEAMEARILPNVKSGSILLFHNDGKYTVEALPAIIGKLQEKGFKFVTVTELLGESLDVSGK